MVKSYGKLQRPTPSLIKVVKVADRCIHLMVGDWSNFSEKALKTLQHNILQETSQQSSTPYSIIPCIHMSLMKVSVTTISPVNKENNRLVKPDFPVPVCEKCIFQENCMPRKAFAKDKQN